MEDLNIQQTEKDLTLAMRGDIVEAERVKEHSTLPGGASDEAGEVRNIAIGSGTANKTEIFEYFNDNTKHNVSFSDDEETYVDGENIKANPENSKLFYGLSAEYYTKNNSHEVGDKLKARHDSALSKDSSMTDSAMRIQGIAASVIADIAKNDAHDLVSVPPEQIAADKPAMREVGSWQVSSPGYESALEKSLADEIKPQQNEDGNSHFKRLMAVMAQAKEQAKSILFSEKNNINESTAANSFDLAAKTGKELPVGEFILPVSVQRNYQEINGNFYKKGSESIAFTDKGDMVKTPTEDKTVIADMVAMAKAKQWDSIKLTGTQAFRREAWLQAESQGIKTQGYTPKEADIVNLRALGLERSTNSIKQDLKSTSDIFDKEKIAPRVDLNVPRSSVIHLAASSNQSTNEAALRANTKFAGQTAEQIERAALWRGAIIEGVRNEPQQKQDETLAKFDDKASDPAFIKSLDDQSIVKTEEVLDIKPEQEQIRDTEEQSL